MDESNKFEGIPEDVKREMLMLFETYSKNELINKLRSLREPSSSSPEKTVDENKTGDVVESTSTGANQSNLDLSGIVNSNDIGTLPSAYDPNQISKTNASHQNEANQGESSKTEQLHSHFTSAAESDTVRYDLVKNNISFNPVVRVQRIDFTKNFNVTSLSDIPNAITRDVDHEIADTKVPSTNARKSRSRKAVLPNDTSSISLKDSDKPPENYPRIVKGQNRSPKANTQSRPNCLRLKKDKELPAEKEVIPKVSRNSDEVHVKSPVKSKSRFSKKLIPNNKASEIDDPLLKIQTNVDAFINETSTADNTKDAPNKNKNISIVSPNLKIKSLSSKKEVKISESSSKITDCHALPNLDVPDSSPKEKKSPKKLIRKNSQTSDSNTISSTISRRKSVAKELVTSNADTEKHSAIPGDNIDEVVSEISSIAHSENPKSAGYGENSQAANESNPIARSVSLRKRGNRIKSSGETGSSVKPKVLSSCSNTNAKTQHPTIKDVNIDQSLTNKSSSINSVEAKDVTSNADAEKHSAITDDKIEEVGNEISSVACIKAHKLDGSCENAPTSIKSNSIASSMSLRKRVNRIKSNDVTVSSSEPKVLEKTPSCSNTDTIAQPQTIKELNIDQSLSDKTSSNVNTEVKSASKPSHSTETRLDDRISVTRSRSLRKLSNIILSNSETASILEQKILEKETASCSTNKKQCQNKESHSSNQPVQNSDAILTSRLRGKRKASGNDKAKSCEKLDEGKHNADAYLKLSKMCSLQGLNLDDIFSRKEVKEMIEKYKNNPEAIVFFGTSQCNSTGKVEPIIHVHKSKKILLETLAMIQNKNGVTLKTCK